eukprot:288802_1
MSEICSHFEWKQKVSFIEAVINVFGENVDIGNPPNIFNLCVNCTLKVLIRTKNLDLLFHCYSRKTQLQIDKYKKKYNQPFLLDDVLKLEHCITIGRICSYPQLLDYFCANPINHFDKFSNFFCGIRCMQLNWSNNKDEIQVQGHNCVCEEAAKLCGIIAFQYFTLDNIVHLCQMESSFQLIQTLFYKQ